MRHLAGVPVLVLAPVPALLAALVAVPVACAPATLDRPACARSASTDASGRCGCAPGRALLYGACLDPAVADAVCGSAARYAEGRCDFRACLGDALLDADGACVDPASVERSRPCAPGESWTIDSGRAACVPADAACPRGSHAEGTRCQPGAACPAGSVGSVGAASTGSTASGGSACRAVVFDDGVGPGPLVDVGAWALLVLGASGGPGSADLCRPIVARPVLFGAQSVAGNASVSASDGGSGSASEGDAVSLTVRLSVPGGDVSRAWADVHMRARDAHEHGGHGGRDLPPAAQGVAERAVSSLVEALRGLGGHTRATVVDLELSCALTATATAKPDAKPIGDASGDAR